MSRPTYKELESRCSELDRLATRYRSERDHYREKYMEMLKGNEELRQLNSKLSDLLEGVCAALKGPPPELTMWSWHDLPEVAQKLAEEKAVFKNEYQKMEDALHATRLAVDRARHERDQVLEQLNNCPCPTRILVSSRYGPHGKSCNCERNFITPIKKNR